jgi:PAS domain S-box-containing protein
MPRLLGPSEGGWRSPRTWSLTRRGVPLVLITVASTAALRASLDQTLGQNAPLLAFVLPVAICAALGGFSVGIVATATSFIAGSLLFIAPHHAESIAWDVVTRLVLFLVVGFVISLVSGRMHAEIERSREAERALREREQAIARGAGYFRALVASPTLGIISWRAPDMITDPNDAFLQMIGYSREDLEARGGGFSWNELTPAEYRASDERAFQQLVDTGMCPPYEKEYVRKNGSRVPVLIGGAAVLDRTDGLSGVAYTIDLSRLRRAEQALRESEARLRFTLEAAQAGSWDWDIETGRSVWSEQYYKLYGVDPSRPASFELWAEQVHPEDRARTALEIEELIAGKGEKYRSEHRIIHPQRGVRWVISLGQVVRDERGKAVRMLGLSLDITERKTAEELDRAARAEAERASRLKDEFVATLSHELRTPLTAILGWAQIMRRSPMAPDKLERGLEVIERNARVLSQLVSDLLDVSRMITGKIRLDLAPVDLGVIVRRAADAVHHIAEARGVALVVDVAPIDLPVLGDAARLEQVVWNLLSNGIKFTPPGGRIDVRVVARPGSACVVVRDTGQGIAAGFVPHLFERFVQEDASSSRKYGGLGLGLSLVKHIAELHGGRVTAESAGPGRGATFTVELPLRPASVATRALPDEPSSPPGFAAAILRGIRVLVVEQDPEVRALVRRLLEESSAEVAAVGSVPEALAVFDDARPDVIVADISLPGTDAAALLRTIRERSRPRIAPIPALALVAFGRDGERTRALAAGYTDQIAKPVDPTSLVEAVARLARREQPRRLARAG